MKRYLMTVAVAMMTATMMLAQTERSDDFKAKYELKLLLAVL